VWVTREQLPDPYSIEITCSIERGGKVIFSGSASTANMCRKIDELVEYLMRANPVPSGSVLMTGTGIIAPHEASLREGDIVRISAEEIGELVNTVAVVR
jgi:2-dehydro-3-deoxy-D-arabinonate dehydratase